MRWLSVDKATGSVKVQSGMDRESSYVRDNKYTVLVLAYDNGKLISTGLSLPFLLWSSLSCNSLLLLALTSRQTPSQPQQLAPWL